MRYGEAGVMARCQRKGTHEENINKGYAKDMRCLMYLPTGAARGAKRQRGGSPSTNLNGSLRNSAVFPHWEQANVPSFCFSK